MDCKEFSNLLDASLEGALPPEDEKRLEVHAAVCADCAARLCLARDLRTLDAEVQVPADFSAAWRGKLDEEDEEDGQARRARPWRSWLTAAAALVFVVGGTLLTRQHLPLTGKNAFPPPAAAQATAAATPGAFLADVQATSLPDFREADLAGAQPAPLETALPMMAAENALYAMEEAAEAPEEEGAWDDDLGPMAAKGASVSNVIFADSEAEDMVEDAEDTAVYTVAEEADEPAQNSGSDAGTDQSKEPTSDMSPEQRSFWQEAGLLAQCALPWLAAAAAGLLALRWIRNRNRKMKGRNES